MSKNTPLVSLLAVVFVSLTALPGHASDLQSEFVFLRNDSLLGTQWSSIPFLSSTLGTEATLTSPDEYSSATANEGAYSSSYSSFQDMIDAATSGPWSLVIDPQGNPQTFGVDLSFPAFEESLFGAVTLTTPGSLTDLSPTLTEFAWTGPSGYSSIDFIIQSEDYTLISYDTLAPTQTSFTLNSPLLQGNYRLTIRYVTELTDGQILVSSPEGDTDFADTGLSWSPPQIKAWSEGSFEISVIPEPSAALLAVLGLCGLSIRRTRRA